MLDYSKGFGHTDASRPAKLPSDIMLERVIERRRLTPQRSTDESRHTISALGQKQTCAAQKVMSALPPKADMCGATRDVR